MTASLQEITQRVIEDACTIQQIPAPTFQEKARADFISSRWNALRQLQPEIDEAGNVLALYPGTLTTFQVVITAHMDTVFPAEFPLHLIREENRICGAGIGDNALGCAALLNLPSLIDENPATRGNLWLVATTGEEGLGNLKGMKALLKRFEGMPTVYISLEGMGLGCILHQGLGVSRYRVEIQTPGGHSWSDAGAPSAVHEIIRLSRALLDMQLPRFPRTTLNIGIIHGGTSINSIAPHALIEVDLRSETPEALRRIENLLQETVRRFESGSVKVFLTPIGNRPAGSISENHPMVTLLDNILHQMDIPPRHEIGSTEANLPLSLGIPAVTIGITNGAKAHTAEEYIECLPIEQGLWQLREFLRQIWNCNIFVP